VELLSQINALDVAIFVALAGGLMLGFRRGVIRQLLGMAAFYVALVLGAQYHRIIGGWIMSMGSGATWVIVDALSFCMLFVVVLVIFNWVGYQVYSDTRITFLRALDNIAGAAFGLLTMVLELIIGLSILRFMVSVNWSEWESLRQEVLRLFTGSTVEDVFLNAAPGLFVLIRPWLPAGLPAIFSF